MATVKVLLEGFIGPNHKAKDNEEIIRCTTALIFDGDKIILSDPGVLESQDIMIDALTKENLTVNDITDVFITHSHMDHYRNIGMFKDAKSIDYWGIWEGEKCIDFQENFKNDISDHIRIINTPGHSYDGMTMLVKTDEGTVAIAGDLWWSERGPAFDKFAGDMTKLEESRKIVLKLADFIVPGHGKMFKVKS